MTKWECENQLCHAFDQRNPFSAKTCIICLHIQDVPDLADLGNSVVFTPHAINRKQETKSIRFTMVRILSNISGKREPYSLFFLSIRGKGTIFKQLCSCVLPLMNQKVNHRFPNWVITFDRHEKQRS